MESLIYQSPQVDEFKENWLRSSSVNLDNLFTYETQDGIERYDTFLLSNESAQQIIDAFDDLESENPEGTQVTLKVIMGEKTREFALAESFQSASGVFQPILEVSLSNSIAPVKVLLHFFLESVKQPFVLSAANNSFKNQISPQVAELFILNWQCLTTDGVINAFAGITAEKIINESDTTLGEIQLGTRKLRRVTHYTFSNIESLSILKNLKKSLAYQHEFDPTRFHLHLGTGLIVPDFHPFNFRPIIKITSPIDHDDSLVEPEDLFEAIFYDTSRPCPPFCDPSISTPL